MATDPKNAPLQPAQPQKEPDAIVTSLTAGPDGVARSGLDRELPLMAGVYLAPQPAQRKWVGLTDDEINDIWAESSPYYHEDDFARAIEAKLKEKNQCK